MYRIEVETDLTWNEQRWTALGDCGLVDEQFVDPRVHSITCENSGETYEGDLIDFLPRGLVQSLKDAVREDAIETYYDQDYYEPEWMDEPDAYDGGYDPYDIEYDRF